MSAEIFDLFQLLCVPTGYNDHTLRCRLQFAEGRNLDAEVLRSATELCLRRIPILGSRFVWLRGRGYWQPLSDRELSGAFSIVASAEDLEAAFLRPIPETEGPQLRVCLLENGRDCAVVMNHMVSDGVGLKEFLYYLANCYTRLLENPDYLPPRIAGDRSYKALVAKTGRLRLAKALVSQGGASNSSGSLGFPFAESQATGAFVARRMIPAGDLERVGALCRAYQATINDALLAAYSRSLWKLLGCKQGQALDLPFMIDLRRYLGDKSFTALRNLVSTATLSLKLEEGESFETTLLRVKSAMDRLKEKDLGLGGLAKLSALFGLAGFRKGYKLLSGSLQSPRIAMTNLGKLDEGRLRFGQSQPEAAFACGSIKYKPHFQVAVSGFKGSLTISTNLYGSAEDKKRVEDFLEVLAKSLVELG